MITNEKFTTNETGTLVDTKKYIDMIGSLLFIIVSYPELCLIFVSV